MPRPRNKAGELGTIGYTVLANGMIRARARVRDDTGAARRISGMGATERDAEVNLRLRVEILIEDYDLGRLTPETTVAQACKAWIAEKHAAGLVEVSTVEAYEDTVKTVIIPICGELMLADLTVVRCDRIIRRLAKTRSISSARKARTVLSQMCGHAIRVGAMPANPFRDVQRLPSSKKKQSYLTPDQIAIVRQLMRQWRLGSVNGPRPDVTKLEDGMDIMIGTSCRIGEALALRRCDVDIASTPPVILIGSTLSETRENGLVRKPTPKRERQTRRVALPEFTITAINRRLSLAAEGPIAFLFATKSGQPYSISNYERLLRTFVKENEGAIRNAGIVFEEFSSHLFRRTAATLVERAGGLSMASRLLGHASEAITRANYVVTAEMVDPMTATILNAAVESGS